ncbi:hypothetical protein IWQ62_000257 [Dispira parvispora]|uniref:LysM domain-containing protein n=1 Tax=Dispira parvispora TaxID=1520584 RepID=A0A9W8B126_9FUNG|nr:hypothetical protein IWQ62_000257 [Dispira parvispora]
MYTHTSSDTHARRRPVPHAQTGQVLFDLDQEATVNDWSDQLVDDDLHYTPKPPAVASSKRFTNTRPRQQGGAEADTLLGDYSGTESLSANRGHWAQQWADETASIKDSLAEVVMPCIRVAAPLGREALDTLRTQGAVWSEYLQGPQRNTVSIYPTKEPYASPAPTMRMLSKRKPASVDPLSPVLKPQTATNRLSTFGSSLKNIITSALVPEDDPFDSRASAGHRSGPATPRGQSSARYTSYQVGQPMTSLRRRGGMESEELERPRGTSEPTPAQVGSIRVIIHPVQKTDTLAGVCLKYGIRPAALRKANKLWATDSIHLRDQLYIPVHQCDSREVHLYNTVMMNVESPFYRSDDVTSTQGQSVTSRTSCDSSPSTASNGISHTRRDSWVSLPASPTSIGSEQPPRSSTAQPAVTAPLDIRSVPVNCLKYFMSGPQAK